METKANYIVTGAFTLAVIFGVFGFVYWVQSGGSSSDRSAYRVVFSGSVSGLHTGSSVLFDGMRVGEVTKLALDTHDPRKVEALIALDRAVPVRADTKVALDFQGLTGLAQIALTGGAADAAPVAADGGGLPTIYADPNASADVTQAARNVLSRIDGLVGENEEAMRASMRNIETVTDRSPKTHSDSTGSWPAWKTSSAAATIAARSPKRPCRSASSPTISTSAPTRFRPGLFVFPIRV